MKLLVNGEAFYHDGQPTLTELLREWQVVVPRTAVMVNGEVIRKQRLESVRLSEGDQVELITITAGG
jgi:thiamine biosynthesis protein ThiS